MKTHLLLLVCLLSLTSCALNRQTTLTTPVGPPPSAAVSRAQKGELAVYSALDYGTPTDAEYSRRYHSGYKLLTADGTPLKYIYNRLSTFSEDPERVTLPPGLYKITARASAFGSVTLPVLIEAGKTTSVHLDGSELSGWSRGTGSSFVSLPDGLVIGWRAKEDNKLLPQ
jgi:hypothetical protein